MHNNYSLQGTFLMEINFFILYGNGRLQARVIHQAQTAA